MLIVVITLVSVFAIERGEQRQERAQLNEAARSIASALDRRGNTSSSYLRAGAALFGSVDAVPASLFRRFVNELRIDSDYRGAEGIGWAQIVPRNQIGAFEMAMTEQVPGQMRVHPLPPPTQPFAVPVTFLKPDTERSRRALGFDMYSEATRRTAMDEAVRTMRPTASGPVKLMQEGTGNHAGFLIYMPVFQIRGGSRVLIGFIYSPFDGEDFLESVLTPEVSDARGIRLYDGTPESGTLLATHAPEFRTGRYVTAQVRVANRPMTVQVESQRGKLLSTLSMITLLFGLAVATLSMIVARLLTKQAYEDQASLDFFAEQNSIRNSLTRELNHRVKNTLANVLSIVSLTRRRATTLEEFANGLDGRIRALSATHDLLTNSEWGTTPIRAVVETEIAPYARSDETILTIDGPLVELAPNDALSLGLAMHELATNAAKYGALSVAGGHLSVTWSLVRDDLARIEWVESEGPSVPADRKRGFGTDLVEKIVAHELKHPVSLRFERSGVECTLSVPVRKPSEFAMRARRQKDTSTMGDLKG
ncbi:CHASE domain-containing protein [Erythrobacter sp. LQ02-29]|uniref:CHASE domain-containing protein n=1 Tax=Erythrobacter sp. LQ02-29 TaxID=2920384 RepID=UPI001F4DCEBC|nr:CHASE domain-containing protein [Erythrobacter sp. LQ02-29]MCP9221612.1 CHASE domain-containing protein [Erythrobacter sp. LQ02-29]